MSNNHDQYFDEVLSKISSNSLFTSRWLRILSYLEYIGYRKIVKAVPYAQVNTAVTHHLSDEIRHSLMLKNLLAHEESLPNEGADLDSKISEIAEEYFQNLDQQIKSYLESRDGVYDPYRNYAMVSYIIEVRAMQTYPSYVKYVQLESVRLVIEKIISDEKEHLKQMLSLVKGKYDDWSSVETDLKQIESNLFQAFLSNFDNQLLSTQLLN